MGADGNDDAVRRFIQRWLGREGGQERANYALFLTELCDVLGLPRPEPAGLRSHRNAYTFERAVQFGETATRLHGRIDLYKRGCFVLEAKQSRQAGEKEVRLSAAQSDSLDDADRRGRRARAAAAANWDTLMMNARRQAEDYARALPAEEGWPPFILICDVGHCIEVFADFSGQGKNYTQFPDRKTFRVYLDDLADPAIRQRLKSIWTDPQSLDPANVAARATRDIARRLAAVSKRLEDRGIAPETAAMFLMRCLFSMFAEDVGLLPRDAFKRLLERCLDKPARFRAMAGQLWEAMDKGGFAHALEDDVVRFNGEFFKDAGALDLDAEEIGELLAAARADWRDVEPAIFGAMLEQALSPAERARLGAHYTPRAYVERLVLQTVIAPLRADWQAVLGAAEQLRGDGKTDEAVKVVRAFHHALCETRVLDPACGTGNFLYVTMEMMRRLEGEVLETLASLGGAEGLAGADRQTVGPHQFHGIEINRRARAIAELVLWIGYLQSFFRINSGMPGEPILRAHRNIVPGDAVLSAGKTLRREGGLPQARQAADGPLPLYDYAEPRRPDWPEADFIVGNPPFIGGKDIRAQLGDDYAEALRAAHPQMNDSADFVMYWWDHAAEILGRKGTRLRRFGFVTTNSIVQVFQRRTLERRMAGKTPIGLVYAVPDHPWTKATKDAAAVRIAMTVAEAGAQHGRLAEATHEAALETDRPQIAFTVREGKINSDLTVGVDVTAAIGLRANEGVCSPGVKLHGDGFIVTKAEAQRLGLGARADLAQHIRPYRNGRDLAARSRDVWVIDLFGLEEAEIRRRYPEVFQRLLETVKPARAAQAEKSPTHDALAYLGKWWLFGKPRPDLRAALEGLPRYIATVETAKHRVFQFLDAEILPDNMLVCIASDDAFHLGVLSSSIHTLWALRSGGWLGVGNDPRYSKSRCFDPFPFPDASPRHRADIAALAEEIDALRKRQQVASPDLTLTQVYNVREKLRAGAALSDAESDIRRRGLVSLLNELHERLDDAVSAAYGWPARLPEQDTLARLVALNGARGVEERRGEVAWLRPAYQQARFGVWRTAEQIEADLGRAATPQRPSFPAGEVAQNRAVIAALSVAEGALSADAIAAAFRQGRKAAPRIAKTIAALVRQGVVASPDQGRSFALPRLAR